MTNLPDFVIIGQEDWDDIWRRNQFIVAELARRFPANTFLFVEMPCDLTFGLRSRQLFQANSDVRRKLRQVRESVRPVAGFANVHRLVAPKFVPDGIGLGEKINAVVYGWFIRRAMRHLNMHAPLLWTQNPLASALIGHLGESMVVYDVTDDWAALAGASRQFVARVTAGDTVLIEKADCVITCSQALYEQKKSRNAHTHLIPNGVDVVHYAGIGTAAAPLAPRMATVAQPVLGYTGSLHEARLDIDLICAVAKAQPAISLVFIGPNFLTPPALVRLAAYPNIHLFGPVAYHDIPAYMQGFTALMIPHKVSAFTESLNPIKLFEYLAAGLPIVATDVAGVRDYTDLIRIAHSPTEFIAATGEVIYNGQMYDRERAHAYAAQARWEERVDMVLDALWKR